MPDRRSRLRVRCAEARNAVLRDAADPHRRRLSERVGFERIGQANLPEDKPPFVIQRLTREAFHQGQRHCRLLAGLKDVEIDPDPRDLASRRAVT